MSLPTKLQHIIKHCGSIGEAARELGITNRHIQNLTTKPGAANSINDRNKKAINEYYNNVNPFPLPDHQNLCRTHFEALKVRSGSQELLEKIIEIEGWVEYSDPDSKFVSAGNYYLSFMAKFSRAMHRKSNVNFCTENQIPDYLKDAENALRTGLKIIHEALQDPLLTKEYDKLHNLGEIMYMNLVVTCVARSDFPGGYSNDELKEILNSMNSIDNLKKLVDTKPYMWQAAYNGLEVASRLERDDATLKYFYGKLVEMDPGFKDLSYKPGEAKALDEEPAMNFFIGRIHTNNIPKLE